MVSRVLRVHAGVQCDPADRRAVPTVLGQWDERRPVRLLRRHRHGHGEPQPGGAHQSRGAGAGDGAGQSERGRRHRVRRFATYRGRAAQQVSGERHFLKKEARMHATIKSEKGMALLMALGAIVIIGVLVGGVVFVSTQDYRIGGNTVRQTRAAAAAELGLNRVPQDWNLANNQRAVGSPLVVSYTAPRGASARVTITRVSGVSFWVVSEGTAGALGSQATARRRYGTFFKLATPQMNFQGAITTQGNTTINGNVTVNGNDAPPATWGACGNTAPTVAGAAISPTTTATVNGSVSLSGSPPVLTTPTAGDTNTYFTYGSSTYQPLAAAATYTYAAGTLLNGVGPLVVGGVCQASVSPPNWGQPTHAAPPATPSARHFPGIHG